MWVHIYHWMNDVLWNDVCSILDIVVITIISVDSSHNNFGLVHVYYPLVKKGTITHISPFDHYVPISFTLHQDHVSLF